MACAQNTKLKPIKQGDTWDGITIAMSSTGTAFTSALTDVEMTFKDNTGTTGLALNVASGITINSASAWNFTVTQILEFPLAVGTWYWTIKTTDAAGVGKTRNAGSIEVTKTAT